MASKLAFTSLTALDPSDLSVVVTSGSTASGALTLAFNDADSPDVLFRLYELSKLRITQYFNQ